ncbi:MAG: bifunctional adenosylcobinamide kinase/adenosylcobinamide-phosphate guanylyltransferase [Lachnospiraceae bacterium]|nr:bifunctional adenosylcobinamide kinase/adenosylcobinamide-phosphate guanylyltransferase [Lachnospiraceae bacterium]
MMILLTGGSACGKSTYAEEICMKGHSPKYYLAAMQPYGEEGQKKVERHRILRAGKGFETIERYTDYGALQLPKEGGTALLECICNLTANEMFDESGNQTDPYERVIQGVRNLQSQCDLLVVVTNDVGSDGLHYDPGTEDYIRVLGKINAALASSADTVIEMVAGIPILLKGALPL